MHTLISFLAAMFLVVGCVGGALRIATGAGGRDLGLRNVIHGIGLFVLLSALNMILYSSWTNLVM